MARTFLTHLVVASMARQSIVVAPNALVYTAGRGQDPQVFGVNNMPGPPGFENAALLNSYRAYDRALNINSQGAPAALYAWQGNEIFGLTAPPNWTSEFTVANQHDVLTNGVHTGLYPVSDDSGRYFLCGFYKFDSSGTGWVKFDTVTGVWSESGAGQGVTVAAAFSRCVSWKGFLCHATGSRLQLFRPDTNRFSEIVSPVAFGSYAKVFTMAGRLFIAACQDIPSQIHILEFAFGQLIDHGAIAPEDHSILFLSNGDFACKPGIAGLGESRFGISCMIFWDCSEPTSPDSDGHRAHAVICDAPVTQPGNTLTISETGQDFSGQPIGSQNIPKGQAPSEDSSGFTFNFRYPGASIDPPFISSPPGGEVTMAVFHWEHAQVDLAYQPPFSDTPPLGSAFNQLVFNQIGIFQNTDRFGFGETCRRIDWQGVTTNMKFGVEEDFLMGANELNLSLSQVTDHRGGNERVVFNRNGFTFVSAEPYADGTITRGMLIKFHAAEAIPGGPPTNMQVGFGAINTDKIDRQMTLSIGDGIDVGGVATLNAGLNRLEDVRPVVNPGNPGGPSETLILSGVIGVFAVSEAITAAPSGATGTVQIFANGNLHVLVTGGAFLAGDVITGGTSGATATVVEVNGPGKPVTYQFIWDLDTDDPGDLFPNEWVAIQTTQFAGANNAPGAGNFFGSGTHEFVVQTVPFVATPPQTGGPPTEIAPLTSGSPGTIGGPPTEIAPLTSGSPPQTGGPPTEIAPLTSGSPPVTGGPPTEITPDTSLTPDLGVRVPGRPSFVGQGGLIGWQTNTIEQGVRAEVNFEEPTPAVTGQQLEAASALPAGPVVSQRLDGVVELGRATVDSINDAVNSRQTLLDMDAAGLTDVVVLEVVARAVALTGPVTQDPFLTIGTECLSLGLEAYYKFNDDGLDSSGNGLTLGFTGVEGYRPAKFGNGYVVLGADGRFASRPGDDAVFNLGAGNAPFAMETWLDIDAINPGNTVYAEKGNASNQGWQMNIAVDGRIRFVQESVGLITTAAGVITPGVHHVVVTSNGSTIEIWVDGVMRASQASAATVVSTNSLILGNRALGGQSLNGSMDEQAFWSRGLLPVEIAQLWNGGNGNEISIVPAALCVPQSLSTDMLHGVVEQVESIPLIATRPVLVPGDVLYVQLDQNAIATAHQMEVVAYGLHRLP